MIILETRKLTRKYGSSVVVDSLDLKIEEGEAFALLGPNGAGKTTVIKMLTTLLPVSSGDAFLCGFSVVKQAKMVRRVIGYVPQMLSVDGTLTGMENLLLFARLYDIPGKECKPRVMEALSFMGLEDAAKLQVHEYSGGMIRRLEIAQSMLHRPRVLFLDEPTVGLDPIACKTVWDHILKLKKDYNTTILMTTHLMEEADTLCNRIAFLSRGKLVITGTPKELKNSIADPNATLEDAFIHYTSETLEDGSGYQNVSRERKNRVRLG
ncbi:ATP-binding cassette domain-containing protein [Leptospira stimsonii]|uniref:ABC transporter ATP-binding protein n=1 Tax=Leptospira stimsonii TaxID=2202203 RepID=A0A4R9L836_9LEPT|nr:ATP-binding cassette domain-containing protein [Leptospira stimsonii]RHX83726.1 multidrug ABC transporter ATP-binding protein [Leptospira stimsonii]TGK18519.1 ABC transporter ATP-binding protein [Leptospira stimsonii]TGM21841.1 ABC transporter ATP-binding protein [Leptospira stimsonii]